VLTNSHLSPAISPNPPNSLASTFPLIGAAPVFLKLFPAFISLISFLGQAFTPVLSAFYKEVNATEKQIEIIYISGDHDTSEYNEYTAKMPWKALPYGDELIGEIAKEHKVQAIPTLLIIKDGKVISTKAVKEIKEGGPTVMDDYLSA